MLTVVISNKFLSERGGSEIQGPGIPSEKLNTVTKKDLILALSKEYLPYGFIMENLVSKKSHLPIIIINNNKKGNKKGNYHC